MAVHLLLYYWLYIWMLKLCGSERSERLLNDALRSVYTRRVPRILFFLFFEWVSSAQIISIGRPLPRYSRH